MHFVLKHKPELVSTSFEEMIKMFPQIRCPIAWITSALKPLSTRKEISNGTPTETSLSKSAQRFMEYAKKKSSNE